MVGTAQPFSLLYHKPAAAFEAMNGLSCLHAHTRRSNLCTLTHIAGLHTYARTSASTCTYACRLLVRRSLQACARIGAADYAVNVKRCVATDRQEWGGVQEKVNASCLALSSNAALVIEGQHLRIEGLRLEGALVVELAPQSRLTLRDALVQNKGWRWMALNPDKPMTEEWFIRCLHDHPPPRLPLLAFAKPSFLYCCSSFLVCVRACGRAHMPARAWVFWVFFAGDLPLSWHLLIPRYCRNC